MPYKGSVVDILRRIRGHLQSAVSYAGERPGRGARQDPGRPDALPGPALRGGAARVLRPLRGGRRAARAGTGESAGRGRRSPPPPPPPLAAMGGTLPAP